MAERRAVVIGGGITGVLTGWELLQAGWEVALVEGVHVGAGSSSRTAAGIRQQFSTRGTVRGMRYAVGYYRTFAERFPGADCPIAQSGYLFLSGDAASWEAAQARVRMQRAAGLTEVEALEGAALLARFPWVDGEVCVGGTFCPTDGFLYPATVYQEGARGLREAGAQLVQGAPVTGAERAGGRLKAVHTPKGTFAGDLFVDATNAWTARTAKVLGAAPLPVDPLKRYLWFLQRDGPMTAEALAGMPLVITPSGAYCRPENRETLLAGRAHEARPEPEFTYADQDEVEAAFTHKSGLDSAAYETWAALAEALPPVGEFGGVTATTSGYYGTTPDHNPYLGFDPELSNLLRLVGFSGHGAMFGPFTAQVAVQLAEAGRDLEAIALDGEAIPLGAFAIGRPLTHGEAMVI